MLLKFETREERLEVLRARKNLAGTKTGLEDIIIIIVTPLGVDNGRPPAHRNGPHQANLVNLRTYWIRQPAKLKQLDMVKGMKVTAADFKEAKDESCEPCMALVALPAVTMEIRGVWGIT